MALTEKDLREILAMDDESFRALIIAVTQAAGGSAAKASALAADVPSLKKMLSRLTPAEAEALLGRAGKERSEDICRIIGKNGNK